MEQESWKMDKDETGRQPPEGPVFCVNNCGFFGSATTANLCSQCYRNYVLKQAKATEAATVLSTKQVNLPQDTLPSLAAAESPPIIGEENAKSASTSTETPHQQPLQPNRCFTCKKRIGLTGFKCRCGNQFCALHRYHDKHNCSYDYRAAARDVITKANPIVKADKLDKL